MPITRISSSINQGQTMHCPLVLPPMQLPRSLSLQARSARLRMTFSNWYFLFSTTIWFCSRYYCTTYTYHGRLLVNLLLSVYNVTLSCLSECLCHPPPLSAYPHRQSIPSSTLCVCSCYVSACLCACVYLREDYETSCQLCRSRYTRAYCILQMHFCMRCLWVQPQVHLPYNDNVCCELRNRQWSQNCPSGF